MVDQVFLSRTGYRKIDAIAGFLPYVGANAALVMGIYDITANHFHGPLTGNVTGNVSGSAGSVAAANLTGDTLAPGVLYSSLTSVGVLTNLTVTNPINGSVTGNSGTVTTNANLTGPITSVGNTTSVASQTGTGTTFVMDTAPVLITPEIGDATGSSLLLTNTISTDGVNNWKLGAYSASTPAVQSGVISVIINGIPVNILTA